MQPRTFYMTTLSSRTFLLISVLFGLAKRGGGVDILLPSALEGSHFDTPELRWLPTPFVYEGILVSYPQNGTADLSGKAVLVRPNIKGSPTFSTATLPDSIPKWRALNVTTVIYTNPYCPRPGVSEVLVNVRSFEEYSGFMMVEIGTQDGDQLAKWIEEYGNVTVRIPIGDKSDWREVRESAFMIVWSVVFGLTYGGAGALALAKLAAFFRETRWTLTVPKISLALLAVGSIFRCIYCALDPLFGGRWFLMREAHMMLTISFPVEAITTLLLALYWHEMLTQTKIHVSVFLSNMKIPFAIASFVVVALEVVTSSLRAAAVTGLGTLTYIAAIAYAIVVLGISLLFFIVGSRVLAKLREGAKMSHSNANNNTLRRTTTLVIVSGVLAVVWFLTYVLIAVPQIFYTVAGYYAIWTVVHGVLVGGTLTQVASFKMPLRPTSITPPTR